MYKKYGFIACVLMFPSWLFAQSIQTKKDKFSDPDFNNLEEVIRTNDLDSPIRQGVSDLSKGVDNIIYSGPITDSASAQQQSLAFASNLINYFLSLVSFIALVYLIYHGYLMVTAAGDKSQFEKGQKGLKYATIAIAGIFLSWFVISMVFRVLEASTGDVILIQ